MSPDHPVVSPGRDRSVALETLTVFTAAFLFRWVTIDFENDYFMHMAWAADMLRGQWPVRDFVEPGFTLQTLLAYTGLRLGGYQLVWEAVFACAAIAGGAAFTHLAARRLGIPRWLAFVTAAIVVASYPRMYAYPKALVYPAALAALLHYFDRPGRRSVLLLSAATAVAFLFRHDHGAWIGVASVVALTLFHAREPVALVRAVAGYGAASTVLVSPWLLWVAFSGHAGQYVDFLTTQSNGLTNRVRRPDPQLRVDVIRPIVSLAPIDYPVVGIRWAEATPHETRKAIEARYGLESTGSGADDYRLVNLAADNVRALVLDPAVEDTRGIDRGTLRVPQGVLPWLWLQVQRYVPIVRVRVLPAWVRLANAEPWLTWVTFTVPWVALAAVLATAGVRRGSLDRRQLTLIVSAAALSLITYQTLVRANTDSRLGDVAALSAILIAWLVARAWSVKGWPGHALRGLALVFLFVTVGSAMAYGRSIARLGDAGVDGPVNFVRRASGQAVIYRTRPLDVYAPPGSTGLPLLARWLNECTREDERVSVIGFEPQLFFLSERGFAGGLAFYDLGWNSSDRDQALTVERWSRQRVPVVLAMDTEWESFSRDYPAVRAFIDERYAELEHSTFGGGKGVRVFADRTYTPVRTHPATGLTCFR